MTMTARSSLGRVIFDPVTGVVDDDNTGYGIVRFDVQEWHRKYPDEQLEDGTDIDILDLGCWFKDGTYEEPCHEWRIDRDEMRKEDVCDVPGPTAQDAGVRALDAPTCPGHTEHT